MDKGIYADDEVKSDICHRLRYTRFIHGANALRDAVVISKYDNLYFAKVRNVTAPTIQTPTLGMVDEQVAKCFEEALLLDDND